MYGVHDLAGNPYPADRLPFSQALSKGTRVVVEDMVIHRSDGRRFPSAASRNRFETSAGTTTHVIVAFIDITNEVNARAEQAEFANATEDRGRSRARRVLVDRSRGDHHAVRGRGAELARSALG